MNADPFSWPGDENECAALARSMFIDACVSNANYWLDRGSDFVTNPQPAKPFIRSWNAIAKEDRAFRDAFSSLTEQQRIKVIELLRRCVTGAVFSTLCTLDQFPHGEAELFVRDGVCGDGVRNFRIAPTDIELHDQFTAAFAAQPTKDKAP